MQDEFELIKSKEDQYKTQRIEFSFDSTGKSDWPNDVYLKQVKGLEFLILNAVKTDKHKFEVVIR